MYLVAITEVNGPIEPTQLSTLASEIDTTAYELRLLINGGLPAVVRITTDEGQAKAVAAAIARHRFVPVVLDKSRVMPSHRMVMFRSFDLAKTRLTIDSTTNESCLYDDISALIRAIHRNVRESVEHVNERNFRPMMALATGGIVLSMKTTKEVTTRTATRENVLYLFRRGEEHPWILRERSANFVGLGNAMGPSSFENFTITVTRLRALAPGAAYDERLVNNRPIKTIGDGSDAADVLAYILANYLTR
jgi:hypothetical protein